MMFSRQFSQTSGIFSKKCLFYSAIVKQKWKQISFRNISKQELEDMYIKAKNICSSKKPPRDVNPNGVFACNDLNLKEISVYGFDYDYTLACYKSSMDKLLYNLGREVLVDKYMYPKEIMKLEYKPDFTIRGLHYDIEKGLLMKLDSFLQIQLGTVYRGLSAVPDEQVIQVYKNRIVPIAYVEDKEKLGGCYQQAATSAKISMLDELKGTRYLGSSKLYQLADLFSRPEMGLLCNITEYFTHNHIDYHPEILFRDVRSAIGSSHPVMHQEVLLNTERYLEENPRIRKLLVRLTEAKKKLFLITNSPYQFVNKGLSLIVGNDWMDFFDVIIVHARKPKFFTDESRPLRVYDRRLNSQLWDRVTKMEKGVIYFEGTIKQLQEMTGWTGDEVLYFGDHPYSDLADATLQHGWRTGAIIHELIHEIEALNDPIFKFNCNWLQMLTQLIEEHEDQSTTEETDEVIRKWDQERRELLRKTKKIFNPQFGSVFRTYNNPSYFSRRLFRFADIYTSSITNLLQYSTKHKFFPRRGALPHEYASLFM